MTEKKQYFHLVGEDLIEFSEEEYKEKHEKKKEYNRNYYHNRRLNK